MNAKRKHFFNSLLLPFLFLVVIWSVHLIQFVALEVFNFDFGVFGVYPRTVFGLRGVLFAPLIHADIPHLVSNSVPFFALSVMILFFYRRVAIRAIIMIYLLTGLAVWLFARPVFHIGASGVVYGLVAFVFWNGIFRRNLKSIVLALIVTLLYSGYFLGVLPNQEGISWESHLLGGFIGLFTSFWYKNEVETTDRYIPSWELEEEVLDNPYFLDRDIFEKTKQERQKEQNKSGWFS